MIAFISTLLVALVSLLIIPVAVFLVEVIAAVTLPQPNLTERPGGNSRQRIAVLVPAHDEGTGLLATLADIKAQMNASDRLLVVADNCTDDTPIIAAAAGAEVVIRNDPERRGKGYALSYGLDHLNGDPPDTVIIIDADCRLADAAIDRLAAACATTHRPVQALYLMNSPLASPVNYRIRQFAWRVKNWVRPLGLRALGLPCQLMGTGMAFPWDVIRSADLASDSIVEDLKLGLDLAFAGKPAIFCPFPGVTSDFPISVDGIQAQRMRWEHGHIGIILTAVPRLILAAAARADVDLIALVLDIAVPPLSLLTILVVGMLLATGLATLVGCSSTALLLSIMSLTGLITGVLLAWIKCGRDILPPAAIFSIGFYMIGKLQIYRSFFSRKSKSIWNRSERRKM
jgi:glycosyltransferase involved in cell wall biosynthesis